MIKILIALAILIICVSNVQASEVSTNANTTYILSETGITHVLHDIAIDNNESGLYASEYLLNLHEINPINVSANEGTIPLDYKIINDADVTTIHLDFVQMDLNRSSTKNFQVRYDTEAVIKKSGDVWELQLPKLQDDQSFDGYEVKVVVPKSFGEEAFMHPQPYAYESNDQTYIYHYNKDQLVNFGVNGAFGDFQSYKLDLSYHLVNPINQKVVSEIALPPDTDYQRVSIFNINPKPENVYIDADGNWIASYNLSPRQSLDVFATYGVDVYPVSRLKEVPDDEYLTELTKQNEIWDYDKLIDDFHTPLQIYNYVVSKLTYNQSIQGKRNGANYANTHFDNAICTDYTDLTIALLRKAGIPAREIQGYAHSSNQESEPISLVEDVLHSWVEYWDRDRGMWIQIDPTWGDTSGENYFDDFDLKHITFVKHGLDPFNPLPAESYNYGSTPQKDVKVEVVGVGAQSTNSAEITYKLSHKIPVVPSKLEINVENNGTNAIYEEYLKVKHDDDEKEIFSIDILPPFAKRTFFVKMPFGIKSSDLPHRITLSYIDKVVEIPTNKAITTYINIFVVTLFLISILSFLAYKAKGLRQ